MPSLSLAFVLLLQVAAVLGGEQVSEREAAEAKEHARAESRRIVLGILDKVILEEVKRDEIAAEVDLQELDRSKLGRVAIDRRHELRISAKPPDAAAWKALKDGEIQRLCVSAEWPGDSGKTEANELALEPESTETNIGTVPEGRDDFDLRLQIRSGPCAGGSSDGSTAPAMTHRQTIRVERFDFGFRLPPVLVESLAYAWTSLPDTKHPSQTTRHLQKLKLGMNAFFWDKFRDGKKNRFGKHLLRCVGVNVTFDLTIAGPGIAEGRDKEVAVGVVATDPWRIVFVGAGKMWFADGLKDQGVFVIGLSGSHLVKLIKKK